MNTNNIQYPIICFADRIFMVILNEDRLTISGKVKVEKGFYRGMIIVDSDLKIFKVDNASILGYAPPFWGFRLLYVRQYKIKLVFSETGGREISINNLKQMIIDTIDKRKLFWSSGGNVNSLKSAIDKCNSFEELIHLKNIIVLK